jgi:hypothetical protein
MITRDLGTGIAIGLVLGHASNSDDMLLGSLLGSLIGLALIIVLALALGVWLRRTM